MAYGVFGLNKAYVLNRSKRFSTDDTHGWYGGGTTGSIVSVVDRIDFSNDSSRASVRGPLNTERSSLAATGNSNYGWFGGGSTFVPAIYSTVDRINFSNDSSTASVRGSLSAARYALASTGNSNYGWFGGGRPSGTPNFSTVDRIDFFNDSASASVRGPLSLARANLTATGNSNYGWFAGGLVVSVPSTYSTVDRIDFSNDSPSTSVRGPLSAAKGYAAATGNSNYGWFGGGGNPGVSTVDRIDFSNDSSRASVRGPLNISISRMAATGNSNYGWFGGGYSPYNSRVFRLDFSNDSSTAPARGLLNYEIGNSGATSGQASSSSIKLLKGGNFGWFVGGTPGPVSTVDRIDFSNDSSSASVRGPLSADKYPFAALNGPLTDADEESLEKSIRSTVDNGPGIPPPNQP